MKKTTNFDYEVTIYQTPKDVQKKYGILANVSVTINESLAVNDLVIKNGKKKGEAWVVFPSRSYKDAKGNTQYKNVVFPITEEARKEIVEVVLKAYEEAE